MQIDFLIFQNRKKDKKKDPYLAKGIKGKGRGEKSYKLLRRRAVFEIYLLSRILYAAFLIHHSKQTPFKSLYHCARATLSWSTKKQISLNLFYIFTAFMLINVNNR